MVNCYLEQAPPDAKTLVANVPSFGIKAFATAGTGALRGGLVVNGQLYVVSGAALFAVSSSGTATNLGTIPNFDRVYMAGDGTNVFVATGGDGYVYNGSTVAAITDSDFPGAKCAAFLDGYILIVEPDSGRFYASALYDPTDWDALSFATAEAAPDDLVSMVIDHREVFLFGKDSTEVWYNAGSSGFPFARSPSGFMEIGCLSTHGPAKIDNTIFFPANDFTVRRIDGYTPIRISTHAVEQAIESYADKTCYGMTFVEGGHTLYALTFAEGTWVYDVNTQRWHERQSYGYDNWRPVFALRAYEKLFVGDSQSNKIGEMDFETFAEWDQPLVASCTAPSISNENKVIKHGSLELVFETGVGTSGQGADPQVIIDWSDNGGRSWSNQYTRALGATGQFNKRVVFRRLGAARDRVYRYSISDPVRRTLIQATLNAA